MNYVVLWVVHGHLIYHFNSLLPKTEENSLVYVILKGH